MKARESEVFFKNQCDRKHLPGEVSQKNPSDMYCCLIKWFILWCSNVLQHHSQKMSPSKFQNIRPLNQELFYYLYTVYCTCKPQ